MHSVTGSIYWRSSVDSLPLANLGWPLQQPLAVSLQFSVVVLFSRWLVEYGVVAGLPISVVWVVLQEVEGQGWPILLVLVKEVEVGVNTVCKTPQ